MRLIEDFIEDFSKLYLSSTYENFNAAFLNLFYFLGKLS